MKIAEHIRDGSHTFLERPFFVIIALTGAAVTAIIDALIEAQATTLTAASVNTILYLTTAGFIVSLAVLSLLVAVLGFEEEGHIRLVVSRLPSFTASASLALLFVGIGSLFFILPGIYIGVRLSFVPFRSILEGESVFTALGSSWDMTQGRFWHVAVLLAVVSLIGTSSLAVLSLAPERFMDTLALVHASFFTPWAVTVLHGLYQELEG